MPDMTDQEARVYRWDFLGVEGIEREMTRMVERGEVKQVVGEDDVKRYHRTAPCLLMGPKPCPNELEHTDCPESYFGRQAWAEEMLKTHDQVQCPDCGLWAIWLPKLA